MSDQAEELQERARYLGEAKEAALALLGPAGADAAAFAFLERLKRHPALAKFQRYFALQWMDVRMRVIPGGSPAVRDWITCYRWPADPGGESALPPLE